jgi:hypothetical protein
VASRVKLAGGGGLYQLYEPFCLKGAGMDYWYKELRFSQKSEHDSTLSEHEWCAQICI